MDKDRIAGGAKQAKGSVKETVGKVAGDGKLQREGKADKAEGKLQNAVGGVKDALRQPARAEAIPVGPVALPGNAGTATVPSSAPVAPWLMQVSATDGSLG